MDQETLDTLTEKLRDKITLERNSINYGYERHRNSVEPISLSECQATENEFKGYIMELILL